jgi:hypothetical protein
LKLKENYKNKIIIFIKLIFNLKYQRDRSSEVRVFNFPSWFPSLIATFSENILKL